MDCVGKFASTQFQMMRNGYDPNNRPPEPPGAAEQCHYHYEEGQLGREHLVRLNIAPALGAMIAPTRAAKKACRREQDDLGHRRVDPDVAGHRFVISDDTEARNPSLRPVAMTQPRR